MARLKTVLGERERLKEYTIIQKQIDEKRKQITEYHSFVKANKNDQSIPLVNMNSKVVSDTSKSKMPEI